MADQPTQEQIEEIAAALADGKKIQAIKIYREATGKGLKEAKDFVDALIPELMQQDPEKYAKLSTAKGSGCASLLLLCVVLAAVAGAWMAG